MFALPTCQWRGGLRSNGRYPCTRPGLMVNPAGVRPEFCQKCELHDKPVPPGSVLERQRLSLPCLHLGEPTGEELKCATCQGNVRIKVLHCAVHKRCTLVKPLPDTACCQGCRDATQLPLSAAIVRNLIYHLYPVQGNGVWQWGLGELKKRWHLFNGRKIIAVAVNPGIKPQSLGPHGDDFRMPLSTDSPEAVYRELEGLGCEFIVLPNDPSRRELASQWPLFDAVKNMGRNEVTLYAQSKAVTRPAGGTYQAWAKMVYELYLDHWDATEALLRRFPVVGSLKVNGNGWNARDSLSDWHFSGSWAWFRADLFRRDWRKTDQFWSGMESYWSKHFLPDEAGVLFGMGTTRDLRPFQADSFARLEKEYLLWAKNNWVADGWRMGSGWVADG